jgi:DNA mismatch endonuclease (patch repair protein)
MSRIPGSNTSPELFVRKALFSKGIRGWRLHARDLPGRPDIVFRKLRIAIFVDGAFWHGHPYKFKPGRLSPDWEEKILSNRRRDRRVNAALKKQGWKVLRLWDLDLRRRPEAQILKVVRLLSAVS